MLGTLRDTPQNLSPMERPLGRLPKGEKTLDITQAMSHTGQQEVIRMGAGWLYYHKYPPKRTCELDFWNE